MKKFRNWLKHFFFPPFNTPFSIRILPYAILGILTIAGLISGIYGWDYSNSPAFCGTTCHTMPPQNATYLNSPHANVYCTECHIGRSFLNIQLSRKTEDVYEIYSMVFHTYTFPIQASRSRPARETCEKCHQPEAFSADSLLVINHFQEDQNNTPFNIYLVMKTGGGAKEQGLGKGIHWHIVNKVEYYTTDPLSQNIPYIRVYNDDGTTTEYVDATANFDPSTIDESKLKVMDCITCHNRVTHDFRPPADSVDSAMARGLISPTIPEIRKKGVEVLSVSYTSQAEAMAGIAGLENYYKQYYADFLTSNAELVSSAITAIQDIYNQTVFIDQKVDWTTHPNNLGHINSPGCFRCHDGKHLDVQQQAIRLECNLCHSIPVVATSQDFVTSIEISRGPEPSSHLNPNWISLHNSVFDASCSDCHTTGDPGGTSNTSFCSNSTCHGTDFTYAGFDAPALRAILQAQLPTPTPAPTLAPVLGIPTYIANIQPIFTAHCTVCHSGATPQAGLDLSTYSGVMKGGKDGVVIVPGDSAGSKLVEVQSGQHFANLSAEELELVKQWIDANAPEK
ncbi:MAG TPA: c-type cytochrome domain-containing protein [Anaerolineales bacterium]